MTVSYPPYPPIRPYVVTDDLQKLIKRLVYADHHALLMQRQEEKLVELKKVADEGFQRAQEEGERAVLLWSTLHVYQSTFHTYVLRAENRVQRAKDAQTDQLSGENPDGSVAPLPPPSGDEGEPPATQNGLEDHMDVVSL